MTNPFDPKYPVNPEYFADRQEALMKFEKSLDRTLSSSPPRPDNLAILGEWGTGKTSLLKKFARVAEEKKEKILAINFQIPQSIDSLHEFIESLLDAFTETIQISRELPNAIKQKIFAWKIEQFQFFGVKVAPKEKEKTYLTHPTSLLRSSLIKLWNDHLKREKIKAVLLFLDDIHYLVNTTKGAIYDLRAVFQQLPDFGCNYQLVITGNPIIFANIRDLAEPLTRFFDSIKLGLFDLKSTKDAITLPLKKGKIPLSLDDEVIVEIHEKTAGHPYFISFIMKSLLDSIQEGIIAKEEFRKLWPEIFFELSQEKFFRDHQLASEAEQTLLKEIAKSTQVVVSPSGDYISEHNPAYWDRLTDKGLLVRIDRGQYKLYHPLFGEYLKETSK